MCPFYRVPPSFWLPFKTLINKLGTQKKAHPRLGIWRLSILSHGSQGFMRKFFADSDRSEIQRIANQSGRLGTCFAFFARSPSGCVFGWHPLFGCLVKGNHQKSADCMGPSMLRQSHLGTRDLLGRARSQGLSREGLGLAGCLRSSAGFGLVACGWDIPGPAAFTTWFLHSFAFNARLLQMRSAQALSATSCEPF